VAHKIATTYVYPSDLSPLLSSHLITLDTNPGVYLIGIGETSHHIISKVILYTIKQDIFEAADNLQLCPGQEAGCKAAVYTMHSLFQSSNTQAVLLVDASNAFNSLYHHASLHNLHYICPPLAITVSIVHGKASSLFIDNQSLLSKKRTTQGDPLAMAMYALSTTPLIHRLAGPVTQMWFADDAAAGGPFVVCWNGGSSCVPLALVTVLLCQRIQIVAHC